MYSGITYAFLRMAKVIKKDLLWQISKLEDKTGQNLVKKYIFALN